MDKIYVVTIDEEFEKARTPGAKDIKKRKKRFGQSTLSLFGKTPKSARASLKRQQTKSRKMDEIERKYFPKEVK